MNKKLTFNNFILKIKRTDFYFRIFVSMSDFSALIRSVSYTLYLYFDFQGNLGAND